MIDLKTLKAWVKTNSNFVAGVTYCCSQPSFVTSYAGVARAALATRMSTGTSRRREAKLLTDEKLDRSSNSSSAA